MVGDKAHQRSNERGLLATAQVEARGCKVDQTGVALTTATQQMIEACEVLVVSRDERAIEACHAGEENDIRHARELLHLDDRERIDAALDKTRRDRRAQVLVEGQPHAGSASSRSATHA